MDNLIVDVKLWGRLVGSLVWDDASETAVFEYDKDFRNSGLEVAPLTMPLGQGGRTFSFPGNKNECFKGLPGMIADCLPDRYGEQIITEWFERQGLPSNRITPLDRLCYMGKRGMGALEFEPSRAAAILDESTEIHIDELRQMAEDVLTKRKSLKTYLMKENKVAQDILRVGTSAGGAKPKAIIAYNEKTNEVRSGQVEAPEGFDYWILKFDGTSYTEHGSVMEKQAKGIGNVEYAYHKMAVDCGIKMTECRLLVEGDNHHFMTKRYDRTDSGEKIHVQSAAGIAHLDRDQRHSYEEIFGIIRRLGLPMETSDEFFRRMVFNIVSRNNDDHTKNFSFLMDKKGKWSMAPAFDLCYTYKKGGQWVDKHQLSLNGKREHFTRNDLLVVGNKMGIRQADGIIDDVVEVVSNWRQYAKDCGVRESYIKEIDDNLCVNEIGKTSFVGKAKAEPSQNARLDSEDKKFLINIAVRLTKARYPEEILTKEEKMKVISLFSNLPDGQKDEAQSEIWSAALESPEAKKSGRWLSEAKDYLCELANGDEGRTPPERGLKV